LALLREGLEVARGPVGLDEVGGWGTEIERFELAKPCPPFGRTRELDETDMGEGDGNVGRVGLTDCGDGHVRVSGGACRI
jgi:hypothetical protein